MKTRHTGAGGVRAAFAASALALALSACSGGGGGDGDPVVPGPADDPVAGVPGADGAGAFAAADGSVDAVTGGAAATPFATAAEAPRPDAALGPRPAPTGGLGGGGDIDDDDIDDDDGPLVGAGTDDPDGGIGDDDSPGTLGNPFVTDEVETVEVPDDDPFVFGPALGQEEDGEPVLDGLQNRFVSAEEFDLWVCEAPDTAGVSAVGYLFIEDQGALVLVPDDGSEPASFAFATTEQSPGTLVNAYADVGVSETLDGFVFRDADAFAADSDVFGAIGCERFLVGDEGTGDASVAASIQNTVDETGSLADAWVCRGPQVESDALVYVFLDGEGVFAAIDEGAEVEPLGFAWSEGAPGALDLVYEGGAEERLDGIAFDGERRFDATSSYDGALSCDLVDL